MNYIIGVFVIACVILYVFKRKLAWAMNTGVHLIFLLSIGGVALSLFVTQAFDFLAVSTLSQNGTLQTIQSIDSSVSFDKIIQPGTQFFDKVKNIFTGQQDNQNQDTQKQGVLEQQIYPSLVSSLSGVLRTVTLVVSLIFLVLSLYLSYLFAGSADTSKLERRVKQLEDQLTAVTNLTSMNNET